MNKLTYCEICGKEFYASQIKAKYCGADCRAEARRIRARDVRREESEERKKNPRIPTEKRCSCCGKEFISKGNAQKYCSQTCARMKRLPPTDWEDIVKKCDQLNLSYGQAAARGIL